jgi:hypothetical protein
MGSLWTGHDLWRQTARGVRQLQRVLTGLRPEVTEECVARSDPQDTGITVHLDLDSAVLEVVVRVG